MSFVLKNRFLPEDYAFDVKVIDIKIFIQLEGGGIVLILAQSPCVAPEREKQNAAPQLKTYTPSDPEKVSLILY